jgi:hypothetical protein
MNKYRGVQKNRFLKAGISQSKKELLRPWFMPKNKFWSN